MATEKITVSEQDPDRPRKTASPGGRPSSVATHKARSAWFQARESWPLREVPVEILAQVRARATRRMPEVATAAAGDSSAGPADGGPWVPVGPSNIGGRMTSVVCHPESAERIWAGAAGGGVWRSSDAGMTWEGLWHDEPSLNVGSLAVDPTNPDILYCGTGEANLSADSHPGVGVMRSLDAGTTWQLLAAAATTGLPGRIGALAVDPFDSQHLLAGGVSHVQQEATGLFASTDGGASWDRQPLVGAAGYWCHAVHFHPTRRGLIFVTISAQGARNGVWRSSDGGTAWEQLSGGLPIPDLSGRASLALAPSDPDVLYAQLEHRGGVLDIFRSDDAGDTWKGVGGAHFADEKQMSYGNTIVVHPLDADVVLCGGVDLHRTEDGGQHWSRVTRWNDERGTPQYAHADHHALLMPATRPGWVYDLNDGGMDFSDDSGSTWQNRSNGLATNMFYDLEVAATQGTFIAGGAQDNGTLATLDGQAGTYFELTGGDGGWVVIDRQDPNHLFTTVQHMRMFRHRSSDSWAEVSPPEDDAVKPWMIFVAMDPANTTTVYTGSNRVWRTVDDGDTWEAVSDALDGSDITAIDIARVDSRRVYVGTENGGVFRSTDGGQTWSGNVASTVLPNRTVTRIYSRADNADVVYATVANFGNRHIFGSRDGGSTWADIDRGDLPDAPLLSMALPAAHPERIYVCGDAGVFSTDDEGATWVDLTANLPNVTVVDLVYHEADRTLTAATYGRSIWRLPVD